MAQNRPILFSEDGLRIVQMEGDTLLPKPASGLSPQVPAETPNTSASSPTPVPPPPAVSGDSNRGLSYAEARALGLINVDDSSDNAREPGQ